MRDSAYETPDIVRRWEWLRKDSCETHVTPQARPKTTPIRNGGLDGVRFDHVRVITPILGELFHRVVIRKNVAMNTTQQRNRNLDNGNEQVIRRFANRSITHKAD